MEGNHTPFTTVHRVKTHFPPVHFTHRTKRCCLLCLQCPLSLDSQCRMITPRKFSWQLFRVVFVMFVVSPLLSGLISIKGSPYFSLSCRSGHLWAFLNKSLSQKPKKYVISTCFLKTSQNSNPSVNSFFWTDLWTSSFVNTLDATRQTRHPKNPQKTNETVANRASAFPSWLYSSASPYRRLVRAPGIRRWKIHSFCGLMPNRTWTLSTSNETHRWRRNEHNLMGIPFYPTKLSVCVRADTSPCFRIRAEVSTLCHSNCQHTQHLSVPVSHMEVNHCHTVVCLAMWNKAMGIIVGCDSQVALSVSLMLCRLMGSTNSVQTNTSLVWTRLPCSLVWKEIHHATQKGRSSD